MSYQAHSKPSPLVVVFLFALAFVNFTQAQLSVPFEPRLPGGNIKVKGDLVFVANNIVSVAADPNLPYNGGSNNDGINMKYIDIDGDPTTFSSSSAELNAPSCSAIVYAGLYWGGIYKATTNRGEAYKAVKLKIPGGDYMEIGPNSDPRFQYERIYDMDGDRDGDGVLDPGIKDVDELNGQNMTSYMNYANVTHLLSGLADPNGEYTVADVVASVGTKNVSAGWTMVVIYENMNATSKYISTFDGYAAMDKATGATIPVSGFRTLPGNLPVNATIGAGAIDGDKNSGPSMQFKARPEDDWTYVYDNINPQTNVFNSTISHLGSRVTTRNPASENTTGWDADIIKLPNPNNKVLPNDHDSGEIKIFTSNEGVYLFLTTIAVEIITPEVIVEKKVLDVGGNDITGDGVHLGQTLQYVLRFWNRGNDNATGFSIRDILPENVSLENVDLSNAPGTTMATNPLNPREVTFHVPDALVTQGSSPYEIRIRVDVSNNCHDFVAACSTSIDNTAFSTYSGVTTGQLISDDPSVSHVNLCGIVTPGATNFLMDDLSECNFESEVQICGDSALLTAGEGYDSYTWYRDLNENGQVDAQDTLYNDSDPDSDPKTVTVQQTGQYLVVKESASCGTNKEIIQVSRFGTTQSNPILNFFNSRNGDLDPTNDIQGEVVTCPNDGSPLPKLFLCGTNDSQEIILGITDTQSIVWEKLVEGSCAPTGSDCPNNQMDCGWTAAGSGNAFTADQEGRYRVTLAYSGGCNSIFYFDVFRNNLDFEVDTQDIFCATDGFIRVGDVPSGYGFQLVDMQTATVVVPYSANMGPDFSIADSGVYRVDFTQMDPSTGEPVLGSCIFSTEEIWIQDRELELVLQPSPVTCQEQGSVRIQANGVRGNYHYRLYRDNGSGGPGAPLGENLSNASNDIQFEGLTQGDYVVVVTTDDGCSVTGTFAIEEIPDPQAIATTTKHISCSDGTVLLGATLGFPNPSYNYAIWSKDGIAPYSDVGEIDPAEFQRDTDGVFTFAPGEAGTYTFVVMDGNNCWSISNEITINDLGPLVLAPPTIDSQIVCEGSNTGQISMNASGAQGPYTYTLDDWATSQNGPTFVNLAPGSYTLKVRSQDGCEEEVTVTLDDPATLGASAGISSTGTCDSGGNSEIRFTNVEGGTAPYEFSFDGGSTFLSDGPSSRTALLPPGNHILVVRDARGCTVTLPVNIEPMLPVPNFTRGVDYDCEGNGIVALVPDQSLYDYQYSINTSPVTASTDGNFTGIAPGQYTITATYAENDPPNPSVLLHEDFGSGPTVHSQFTQGYTYEDQIGSGPQINDFEYSVTSRIEHRFGNWLQPVDHTSGGSDPTGRYLVINVGSPSPGQVIYKKPVRDIIPHQSMRVSFAAMNLLDGPNTQLDPDLWVQMRIPGTTNAAGIVGEVQTGNITRNYQWNTYEFTLDPGLHTELDFELVSRKIGNDGNDVAIDDILVEQVPQSCPRTVTIPIMIEAGNAFGANVLGHTDTSCLGETDGTIRFEVENFDPLQGFEYTIDGGITWITSMGSPVTTAKAFGPGMQRVTVRKVGDAGCTIDLDREIETPTALGITTTIDRLPTCLDENNGSIIAAVTGGSPTYQYALTDGLGNTLIDFPNPNGATFSGLQAGDYIILARDINGCSISSDPITLDPPVDIVFEVAGTACYDGTNSATITLDVTQGNGGYRFHLDGGTGELPLTPATDTYTFTGLAPGTYTVNVTDAFGCSGVADTITIDPQLVVNATTTHVSGCADGTIEVTASGGQGTLLYAFVPHGDHPVATDFQPLDHFTVDNALAVANPNGFDLHVRDNNGDGPYCEYIQEDIIVNPAVALELAINPVDPNCNGGNGSLEVDILKQGGISLSPAEISQTGPFTYSLLQGGTELQSVSNLGVDSHTFYNVVAGTYEVRITDGFGCILVDDHIHVTDPPVLTADLATDFTTGQCTPAIGFSFENYPTILNGTLEFSADYGQTWQTSNAFTGLTSGMEVEPSIRTIDGSGYTLCRTDFPPYTLNYPLDDLDISINATVDLCQELLVTVQGSEGAAPYVYTYTDNPVAFDPSDPSTPWTLTPKGMGDPHVFTGLTPGRTYVFFVKDNSNCIRQSSVNVNELEDVDLPIAISETVKPSCAGMDNGSITFNLQPDNAFPEMRWELYRLDDPIPTEVSGGGPIAANVTYTDILEFPNLEAGEYYLEVVQVDASDTDTCFGASENIRVRQQLRPDADVTSIADIGCNLPGLISVTNINGGTEPYTFNVIGPGGLLITTTQNPIEIPANSPEDYYTVIITDVYGCNSNSLGQIYMKLTPNPEIDALQVDNCDGNIEVTVTGSSAAGGLRYAMVTHGLPAPTAFLYNSGIFKGVAPGIYDFYVIDANGCTNSQTLTVHPTLDVNVTRTKLLDCTPSPHATIEINVVNGSGNYHYSVQETITGDWLQPLTSFTGNTIEVHPTLAGTYEVKVTDNAADHLACESVFTIEIPEAIFPEFTATPTDVSCYGAQDGSITMTQTDNGISPLSYQLLDASSNPVDPTEFQYDLPTRTFSGMEPGDYIVRATGTNQCTEDSTLITIGEPIEMELNIPASDVVQFGCALGNNPDNASIIVGPSSISGGTGTYVRYEFVDPDGQVVQDGKNNVLTIADFAGGIYTVNVYDDSGCMVSTPVTINPFDQLLTATISMDITIDCINGGESITVLAQGSLSDSSTGPHDYSFEEIATGLINTDGSFSGLQVGLHAYRVTNTVTGCTTTVIHEVEPIQELNINLIQDSPVVCAGEQSQNHFEILGGYHGDFEWNVFDAMGTLADTGDDTHFDGPQSGSGTIGGNILLPRGSYRIVVQQLDFPYCQAETMVTIGGADTALGATITELGNASCSNDQGRLSVVPSGGIAPYTLEIPALGRVQNEVYGHVFTDLPDGSHSILITDAAGCTTTVNGTVLRVDPLAATPTPAVQTLECIGDADGTIGVALTSGGVGTVLYSLNRIENGALVSTSTTQVNPNFAGLKAGTYSINVQDDAGCSFTTTEVAVEDPTAVRGSLALTRGLTCDTGAQLTLTVDGGTPYPGTLYQWSDSPTGPFVDMNGGDTHVFDVVPNLIPYQYYVRDAHGCEPVASNAIKVNALAPLAVEVDLSGAQINCQGDGTASISAKATGGLGNYVYGLYQDAALTVPLETNNTHGYFSGLFQGTYYVGVSSGDCHWTSAPLVIDEPPALVVHSQVTDVSCMDAADGSITLEVTGGTSAYQFAISPSLNKFDGQGTFTDLAAGDYTVIVQDAKGCFEVLNFTITQPNALLAELVTADEVCHGSSDGSVHLSVSGGTAPYSSSLNSNADEDFNIGVMDYANLPSGDHVVFIRDANGCTTNQFFTIGSGANLAGTVEMAYGCTGNMPTNQLLLTMEDPSVVPDLMYSLDSNNPNDLVLEADFSNLTPGNHSLTIAHANGCSRSINFVVEGYQPLTMQLSNPEINQISVEAFGGNPGYTYQLNDGPLTEDTTFLIRRTDTYTVTVTDRNGCSITQPIFVEYIDIEIPNFFTPDGDGLNDTWKPRNIEVFPKITISVFDRYGRNVYKMLQDTQGWDGFYNESNLPMGDYWYIIKLNGDEDDREFVGHFTLYR